jgi:DNA polymerase III epsilon subunit-like protein
VCIVNYWPAEFRALYGGEWPSSYACVDVETTGYHFDRDLITEWGHCLVEGGVVTNRLSLVVDWTGHATVGDYWLDNRLKQLNYSMGLQGKRCHMTFERMKREGVKPDRALPFIRDFIERLRAKGTIFVAHNGTFDEKMLCANLAGSQVAHGFSFGDNGMLDTEAIEKANQLIENPRMHPKAGDTLRSYFHRVKYTRVNGVKSNLDDHCYGKYGLHRFVPREELHGACADAFCVHRLVEEFRGQITGGCLAPPFYPNEAHRADRRPAPAPKALPPQQPLPPQPPASPRQRLRGQRNR